MLLFYNNIILIFFGSIARGLYIGPKKHTHPPSIKDDIFLLPQYAKIYTSPTFFGLYLPHLHLYLPTLLTSVYPLIESINQLEQHIVLCTLRRRDLGHSTKYA
jgi:hypothetical protein